MNSKAPNLATALRVHVPRYVRQLRDLWRAEGAGVVVRRLRAKAALAIAPQEVPLEVRDEDVIAADLSRVHHWPVPPLAAGQPVDVNWVTVPIGPGSGGGTTIFRIINYLQANGYRNRLFFYDMYAGDHQYYADVARDHFGFTGPVGRVRDGMPDAHAVVATAWATAYPAFNASCAGKRFYFVQDFEPWFHPVGTASILAENTYRMGFHGITAGRWLAQKLKREFGMATDHFDFGCDTAVYKRLPDSAGRNGVVFYARPGAARRGFELGLMAMRAFARRRPEVPLHFYGERMGNLPFRFIDHGRVTPAELNVIYNSCRAGLSLSMTNVSLVPHEMLAAGCIPVVNEGEQNRVVLDNPHVRYTAADPNSIAATLEVVIDAADFDAVSVEASQNVQSASWNDAGKKVDGILRRELPAGAPAGGPSPHS